MPKITLAFFDETQEFFEHGAKGLDDGRFNSVTRKKDIDKDALKCSGCGYVLPPATRVCPVCGVERKRRDGIENRPGAAVTIDAIGSGKAWAGSQAEVWSACCTHASKFLARHHDRARAERQAKAQFKELAGYWPPQEFVFRPGSSVPKAIQRKIDKNYKLWKKLQKATA